MMKMGGNFFWGILLVFIGLTLIIKVVFHIDIPIFRIFFAFIFIYFGIRILTGHSKNKVTENTQFNSSCYTYTNNIPREQNIIFGRGLIDLRHIDSSKLPADFEINTVFGSGEVILPKDIQVRIKVDAAFSGATLPNNNTSAFGSIYYETPGFDQNKPFLNIKISVVFGSLSIRTA